MNLYLTFMADALEMNFENVAAVVFTGIVVVFIGLILLIAFVSFLGLFFKNTNKPKENGKSITTSENKTTPGNTALIVEEGIGDEIVAVITAAIAAMSAKSGKKLVLRSVKNSKNNVNQWSLAGRYDNTRPF